MMARTSKCEWAISVRDIYLHGNKSVATKNTLYNDPRPSKLDSKINHVGLCTHEGI
jgi:hypothetical protein